MVLRMSLAGGGALIAMAGPQSVVAQDDTAARIQQLEILVRAQQKQIEALNARLGEVPPPIVSGGEAKVKASIYGQVNRAILYYDDGGKEDIRSVDNDASSTRIGFKGAVKATNDISLGSLIEVEFESNSSNDITQFDNSAIIASNRFTERKLEVFADSKAFGKLSLGQGSVTTDGITEKDLSGTGLVGSAAVQNMAGGLGFAVGGAQLPLDANADRIPDVRVRAVFTELDGSRTDRIRYDTPKVFGGFTGSASWADGGTWDVALTYGGEIAELKVGAAVGYASLGGIQAFPEDRLSGSLTVLHKSGFNAAFATGTADSDNAGTREQSFWYGKVGYTTKKLFDVGSSSFSIDYGQWDEIAAANDEADSFGIQFVQKVSDWGAEFYAGYRNYELESPGVSLESIDGFLTGARAKF